MLQAKGVQNKHVSLCAQCSPSTNTTHTHTKSWTVSIALMWMMWIPPNKSTWNNAFFQTVQSPPVVDSSSVLIRRLRSRDTSQSSACGHWQRVLNEALINFHPLHFLTSFSPNCPFTGKAKSAWRMTPNDVKILVYDHNRSAVYSVEGRQ